MDLGMTTGDLQSRRRETRDYHERSRKQDEPDLALTVELAVGDVTDTYRSEKPSRPSDAGPSLRWSEQGVPRVSQKRRYSTPPHVIHPRPGRALVVRMLEQKRYLDLLLLFRMAQTHYPEDAEIERCIALLLGHARRTGLISGPYHLPSEPTESRDSDVSE